MRLAGERALIDPQSRRREELAVGRDLIALADLDDVAGHQIVAARRSLAGGTQHSDHRREHVLERLDGALGAVFLEEAEDAVDDDRRRRSPSPARRIPASKAKTPATQSRTAKKLQNCSRKRKRSGRRRTRSRRLAPHASLRRAASASLSPVGLEPSRLSRSGCPARPRRRRAQPAPAPRPAPRGLRPHRRAPRSPARPGTPSAGRSDGAPARCRQWAQ